MSHNQIQLVKEPGHFHRSIFNGQSPRHSDRLRVDLRPAVFLDRDGVLVEDVHYLRRSEQLRILPKVVDALLLLQDKFQIIVATNQSGIARGFFTEEDLLNIHTELVGRLWADGAVVDGLYYCPHLVNAPVEAYRSECDCRKPGPGMILQAGRDFGVDLAGSYLIGDNPRDVTAAQSAGVTGILLGNGASSSPRGFVAKDLFAAAQLIADSDGLSLEAPEMGNGPQGRLTPEESSAI